jgi:hypothetical protein
MYRRLFLLPVLLLATTACNRPLTTTELQTLRMEEAQWEYGAHLTSMTDNAILHDMSVADIHFIPHTSELSGVGVARLNRMAKLLSTYGGTVRYETRLSDQELIDPRLEHVREYLTLAGCDMDRVSVVTMRSAGRGMPGDEAVEKFEKGTAAETDATAMPMVPSGFAP